MRRGYRRIRRRIAAVLLLALPLGSGVFAPLESAGASMPLFQGVPDTTGVLDLTSQREFNRLYSTGYQYYEIQEYAGAIPALKRCTKLDSTNIDVWHLLATCYYQTEQLLLSGDAYQAILRLDPKQAEAMQSLSLIYKELGEEELHLRTWERLVELVPDNPEFREYLLALYQRAGNQDGMLQLLQRQADEYPEDPEVQRRLADLHHNRGDLEAQVEALESAVELDPANTENLERLGRIYSRDLDQPGDAARVYSMLVEVQPENAVAWRLLGRYLGRSGQPDGAAVALQRSLELAPGELRVYSELALLHTDLGHFDEALAWVERALEQESEDAYAYVTWGDILQAKGFAAAEDGTVPYEAKIVLEEAIDKYRHGLALGSITPKVRRYAEQEAEKLEPFRRTQAEIFMHRARQRIPPKGPPPPTESC